ncbi:hypothetical protein HPB50_014273 [Hyalomma asiaticum]|uniref:Uncharacterized protein n=1 Tax=Hyalomma asiaticum TaxID=266040 RepID=A0ACB7SN55_HYAAI|nr:hypothetical protein HPB50_014273 [Hyalomma asiaticum]
MAAAVDCREGRPKKRRNRRYCCVYKCHTEEGYDPNIIFYSFPSKPYEKERWQRWIQAVRRERWSARFRPGAPPAAVTGCTERGQNPDTQLQPQSQGQQASWEYVAA